jgi:hypothetical protein
MAKGQITYIDNIDYSSELSGLIQKLHFAAFEKCCPYVIDQFQSRQELIDDMFDFHIKQLVRNKICNGL